MITSDHWFIDMTEYKWEYRIIWRVSLSVPSEGDYVSASRYSLPEAVTYVLHRFHKAAPSLKKFRRQDGWDNPNDFYMYVDYNLDGTPLTQWLNIYSYHGTLPDGYVEVSNANLLT
jgi:hypothetical protein